VTLTTVGLIRGGLTAILCAAFIALWIWAWSTHRKADFDAASRLPLDEAPDDSPAASGQTPTVNR
jgi:cytochrome c oxidase cbb3-type subunit 4